MIEANGVLRHVQLKATRATGARANVDVQVALADKPGGCVVWLFVDPETLRLGPFLWFGGRPGHPLPALGDREVKHSRGDAKGEKTVRAGLRRVPKGTFVRVETIRDLAVVMFGLARADHDRLLAEHLAASGIVLDPAFSPQELTWSDAADLAPMIDPFALAEAAGLGDPGEVAILKRAEAERTGEWRGSALELWVTLCKERLWDRWQSEGAIGLDTAFPPRPMLQELARALGDRLATLGWPRPK